MTPLATPVPHARARAAAPARAHVRLIVNPRATRADGLDVQAVRQALGARFSTSVSLTERRGHARELAADAALAGVDVVAVIGGDGTASEAAGALAGSHTALTCLPAGCTNTFARAVGTPRRALAAAERLAAAAAEPGAPAHRLIDLGTVNGRPFLCTSGVGFSATMTAVADAAPERKARFGQLHFVGAAAGEILTRYLRSPPRMRVRAAGREAEGVTLVAQNAAALTYLGTREIRVAPAADLESGGVSVTLLRRARPVDVTSVVARLLLGHGVTGHPEVAAFPEAREAIVTSADGRALSLEADGEFLGEHHRIEYGVLPRALRVIA